MKNHISIKKIFLIWINSFLLFSGVFPRLVSLDVLSLNGVNCIYLYGDDHNPAFKDREKEELKVLFENIIKIKNGKTFFWIEDLFATAELSLSDDEILNFSVSNNLIECGALPCGLVQRIAHLAKQNLIPSNVEFRLITSDVVRFFSPYALPPICGVFPPSMVRNNDKLNKFKILISDFFKEIEICKENISKELKTFDCPSPILKKIYDKMTEIAKTENLLKAFLKEKDIKEDDIFLFKAIEIMFVDLKQAGFENLQECIAILEKIKISYPKLLEDAEWIKMRQKVSNLIEDFCENTDKVVKVSRRPVYEFALKIGGGLLEIVALLKILQNLGKVTQVAQVAILGSLHTRNIKDILLEGGFVYNSELSVKEGETLYFPISKIVFKDI